MPVAVVLHPDAARELRPLFPRLRVDLQNSFQCLQSDIEETAAGIVVSARATMTKNGTREIADVPGRILIPWRLVSACFHYESSDDIPLQDEHHPIGFRPPQEALDQ